MNIPSFCRFMQEVSNLLNTNSWLNINESAPFYKINDATRELSYRGRYIFSDSVKSECA